jgi:hypothetical protein
MRGIAEAGACTTTAFTTRILNIAKYHACHAFTKCTRAVCCPNRPTFAQALALRSKIGRAHSIIFSLKFDPLFSF